LWRVGLEKQSSKLSREKQQVRDFMTYFNAAHTYS
jgi:hypothetical protein